MLINRQREKLINAIIYFASNTNCCGKVKLFKLLYFLDFQHYTATGRSVTGLEYYAWEKGPCPKELFEEIKGNTKPDMNEHLQFGEIEVKKGKMLKVIPQKQFDASHFSKKELRLMEELVERYKHTLAEDMIEATHLENLPWHEVYEVQNKKFERIPYAYALRRQEKDEMLEHVQETEEFWRDYK